ncbi:MAG: alcohol dehydrogenase catalytic domain-containing protein [Ktedonobacteraceae bacterium]|nr:alcohol dehydrogenase catalytic domain-containing protein [Ktedonobacteraceae bacterium]
MWTSTIDLDFKKVLLARLIGNFYRNIYFSSYSPLQVQNLPRQSLPKTSWVRVRNHLSGVSGSDLHLLYGDGDMRTAPAAVPAYKYLYPGHELVGEVIEIGDDVQHLHVGDRVVLQNSPNCLSAGILPPCRFCIVGNYNLCENATASPQPIGGGWSEEMLVHEQQLFQVPLALTDEQAVLLDPTAVALHAVLRRLPRHGERVLIIGAGSIGLLLLQIIRTLAPQSEVSVLARHAFQVERATRMGAAHIIYPRDAYVGVKRATQAKLYQGTLGNQTLSGGYDVIFDTVGRRKTLHNALRWTRAQGTIVLVGINLHMMNLDLTPLWYQEINLLGSTSHSMEHWPIDSGEQRSTFSAATELIEQGRIAPEQLITHHFALNNYKHALLTTTNKSESRAIKVVFDYSLLPASVVPNVRASAPRRRAVTANFDIDYPVDEQDHEENGSLEQEEVSQHTPTMETTPYTPVPYPATIRNTPPIRPSTREMPPSSLRPTNSEDEENENEDTAAALPVADRHMYASDRSDRYPWRSASYASTPKHFERAEKDEMSSHQPASQDEEPAATSSQMEPGVEDFSPSTSTTTTNDEEVFIDDASHQDAEVASNIEQEIPPQISVDPDLSLEQEDEYADEQLLQEAPAAGDAPAEVIAAELDPQTLEPNEEPSLAQIQRSRQFSRKRKHGR